MGNKGGNHLDLLGAKSAMGLSLGGVVIDRSGNFPTRLASSHRAANKHNGN